MKIILSKEIRVIKRFLKLLWPFIKVIVKGTYTKSLKFKKTSLSLATLLLMNSLVLLPNSWELMFTTGDTTIRFGHGHSKSILNTKTVAIFGCETYIDATKIKGKFFKRYDITYMGSTRNVLPIEVFTFIPALILKEDIGPWKWSFESKSKKVKGKKKRKK